MNKEKLEERISLQLTRVTTSIYIADPLTVDSEMQRLKDLCREYNNLTGQYFQVKDNKQTYTRKD